jgi:hypothetical protein
MKSPLDKNILKSETHVKTKDNLLWSRCKIVMGEYSLSKIFAPLRAVIIPAIVKTTENILLISLVSSNLIYSNKSLKIYDRELRTAILS